MANPFLAVPLALHLIASGGGVPTLDERPSCHAAAIAQITDFEPTYTELLTCLEMASDARKLPEELY
jgi:hypothetical protein